MEFNDFFSKFIELYNQHHSSVSDHFHYIKWSGEEFLTGNLRYISSLVIQCSQTSRNMVYEVTCSYTTGTQQSTISFHLKMQKKFF